MERCQHRDGVHCLLSPNLLCLCCMLYLQMAIILNKPDVLRRRLPFYNHKRVRAASGTETWVHWISSRVCYRLGHSHPKGGRVPQGGQLFPFKFEKNTMKNKFQAFKFKGIFQRTTQHSSNIFDLIQLTSRKYFKRFPDDLSKATFSFFIKLRAVSKNLHFQVT